VLAGAGLTIALVTLSGPALGQMPRAPTATLERAAALVQSRAFGPAAAMLRQVLSVDPENRSAQEMLAFALESMGDLKGERQVRSALAAAYPNDARIQADCGRVLERSGDEGAALRAYLRARDLSGDGPAPELDGAIERMRGRTSILIGTPRVAMTSDPDAQASSMRVGVALPLAPRLHVALLGTHDAADSRTSAAATTSETYALALVRRQTGPGYWTVGPSVHLVAWPGAPRKDIAPGGTIAGRAPVGPRIAVDWRAEAGTAWDEAATAVLHGGRTTAAEGHVYANGISHRLLLQAGARRRQLSILDLDPASTNRLAAWQSLWLAGADFVVWRKPGAAVRGEMLDQALIVPTTLSSAVTAAYRHYDVSSQTTPQFNALIALAPQASVDEASVATTLASPRGDLGLELRGGLAHDSARRAHSWRAGGAVIWAPRSTTRFSVGYEQATEVATGLVGQHREGWVSLLVDL